MRGLYLSEGAMLVQQAQLQNISNNLANLRTNGFKRDQNVETSFAEWMVHELHPENEQVRGGQLRPIGSKAHNVATQETVTSFAQGPLDVTDRNLDFALVGDGFFQVDGEEEILYTRNGRFELDEEGTLVSVEGYPVLGEGGPIELNSEEVYAHSDGTLYEIGEDGETVEIDTLDIAVFDLGETRLEKHGENYFITDDAPDGEEEFEVVQGFLEGSNANLAREMTDMMKVRRSYEAAQKIMITYDQILDRAANELGASV